MPNRQAAKSGLNKSMTDAALGQFVKILAWVAFKLGKGVHLCFCAYEIPPSRSSCLM